MLIAVAIAIAVRGGGASAATAEAPLHYRPELGLPATGVVAFGASPAEEAEEAWAYGMLGPVPPAGDPSQVERLTLLRHTDAGAWEPVALPGPPATEALGAEATPDGALVLLTDAGIVLRAPGGAPALVPSPPGAPPVAKTTPYAVVDEAGGAGLFLAPYIDGREMLHYSGGAWTGEPIEGRAGAAVEPLALGCGPSTEAPTADSAGNCWLLAKLSAEGRQTLGLFRRVPAGAEGGAGAWTAVTVSGGLLGAQASATGEGQTLAPLGPGAQMLTVTSQGAWVDFAAPNVAGGESTSATELVEPDAEGAKVAGSWCYPSGGICAGSLGAPLPAAYRSFAWPGNAAGEPGERVITGLPDRALLELSPSSAGAFAYTVGPGGSDGSAPGGAAFASPQLGFVADGVDPAAARDGGGQSQVFALTAAAEPAPTGTQPVPFSRPLLAVATAPGADPGSPESEAVAVGLGGAFAHFVPKVGWRQDPIEPGDSEAEPDLRAVAWAGQAEAVAVGDRGAIWDWGAADGVWKPDPASFPGGGDLDGIAFSAVEPTRGYIVGAGRILGHGASGWEGDPLPPELPSEAVDFTSVAFAKEEALATYRTAAGSGGVIDDEGGGWQVDAGVAEVLAALPAGTPPPEKVAGLADGGAVLAGPGYVIEREGDGDEWRLAAEPLPEARAIAALAAFRDKAGKLRAVVSIALGPASGYLLRQTDAGWEDLEHDAWAPATGDADMPRRPEPVAALVVSADGEAGLAVGGHDEPGYETAAALRFPPAPPLEALPPEPPPEEVGHGGEFGSEFFGERSERGGGGEFFGEEEEEEEEEEEGGTVVGTPEETEEVEHGPLPEEIEEVEVRPDPVLYLGGGASCAAACADQAEAGPGPDALLLGALDPTAAEAETAKLEGAKGEAAVPTPAFVYTGGRLEAGAEGPGYGRETARLAALFGKSGRTPILTVPSPDLIAEGPAAFSSTFAAFGPGAGSSYYAYRTPLPKENGETVRVLVLDLSSGSLGPAQEAWLREELLSARKAEEPSVAVGDASLGFKLPDPPAGVAPPARAEDGETVAALLVEGGASAYVYDYPGADVVSELSAGGATIPAYGTGALGYGLPTPGQEDWLGSSAFLGLSLGPVSAVGAADSASAVAVPDIESLSLHTAAGLRVAVGKPLVFEALGRVPAGGTKVEEEAGAPVFDGPEPYVRMPAFPATKGCVGPNCAYEVPLEYSFTSSKPEIGRFLRSTAGAGQPASRSGVLCGERPGTTVVTVSAGGLTTSEAVTVTGGEIGGGCRSVLPPTIPGPNSIPVSKSEGVLPGGGEVPGPGGEVGQVGGQQLQGGGPGQSVEIIPGTGPIPNGSHAGAGHVGRLPHSTPAIAPHANPGGNPAPPSGLSPATQPVIQHAPQSAHQTGGQGASAPSSAQVPGTAQAPGVAPGRAAEEEVALQHQHLAVRFDHRATWTIPTAGLLLGPAVLLALAVGAGATTLDPRRRRPAWARADLGT